MRTIVIKILAYWLTLAVLVAGLAWQQPQAEARPAAQVADEIRPVCVSIAGMSCSARLVKPLADQRAVVVNDIIAPLYGGTSTAILNARMPERATDIVQSGRQLAWAIPPDSFENGQLYLYDLDRGPVARGLMDAPQRVVGFDSTGTYVVYLRYGGGLFRVRVDGAAALEPIGLQTTGAIIDEASLLPDGRILASTTGGGFSGSVYVISGVETAQPVAAALATVSRSTQNSGQPLYRATPDGQRLVFMRAGVLYSRSLIDPQAPVVRLSPVAAGEVKTYAVSNGFVAFQSDVGGQTLAYVVPSGGPVTAAAQIVTGVNPASMTTTFSGPLGARILRRDPTCSNDCPPGQVYTPTDLAAGPITLPATWRDLMADPLERYYLFRVGSGLFSVPINAPLSTPVALNDAGTPLLSFGADLRVFDPTGEWLVYSSQEVTFFRIPVAGPLAARAAVGCQRPGCLSKNWLGQAEINGADEKAVVKEGGFLVSDN